MPEVADTLEERRDLRVPLALHQRGKWPLFYARRSGWRGDRERGRVDNLCGEGVQAKGRMMSAARAGEASERHALGDMLLRSAGRSAGRHLWGRAGAHLVLIMVVKPKYA